MTTKPVGRKRKVDLSKVPTNALMAEIQRRESKEYHRRVGAEYRAREAWYKKHPKREVTQ